MARLISMVAFYQSHTIGHRRRALLLAFLARIGVENYDSLYMSVMEEMDWEGQSMEISLLCILMLLLGALVGQLQDKGSVTAKSSGITSSLARSTAGLNEYKDDSKRRDEFQMAIALNQVNP